MKCYYLALVIALALLIQPRGLVAAQSAYQIVPYAAAINAREHTLTFRVVGADGRDVLNLDRSQVQIREDESIPVTRFQLDPLIADTRVPSRTLTFDDGKTQKRLCATGAAISVVFDGSTLMGQAQLDHARLAAEQFLLLTGAQAPCNAEAIGLFLPIAAPNEQAQQLLPQADADGFIQDRNAVINGLRTMTPRTGKTSLYAAIQEAVKKTSDVARRRGSNALILVLSDGGDTISGDTYNTIITQANANQVKIVAFGIGTDKALIKGQGGFRLNQLANATGGVYEQRPTEDQVRAAFTASVVAVPVALYTVRYQTALIDDGKSHYFTVQVTLPDGQVTSQPIPFAINAPAMGTLRPLGETLLRQYFMIAAPMAVLFSLGIVLAMGAMRWSRRPLGGDKTAH